MLAGHEKTIKAVALTIYDQYGLFNGRALIEKIVVRMLKLRDLQIYEFLSRVQSELVHCARRDGFFNQENVDV